MKTILIATDFSPAAKNATRFGFELSKSMNAKVILFTAYQHHDAHTESLVPFPVNDQEKETYGKLADEAEKLDPNANVELETLCQCGPVTDSIIDIALENNVSFIIIGMKKAGLEFRKYFGSTVTALSKQSPLPVISVPEDATFCIPNKIALACDTGQTNIHVLDPLKTVADTFKSSVSIITVLNKSKDEVVERHFKSVKLDLFLAPLTHTFEYLKEDNVAKAILEFANKNEVGLIAVIPHRHNLLERLITRSITKDLIFKTNIPLLILPSKQLQEQDVYSGDYYSNYYECVY